MEKEYKLYVDMDGVLTDFEGEYEKLTGIGNKNGEFQKLPDYMFYAPISKAGKDFWTNMSWMNDGKTLWGYVKKYSPKLLSSPTRSNSSRVGKFEWVQKELPGVELILRSGKNKKEFATPTSILIDDRGVNIDDWVNKGGIGIKHVSTENTIKELKKLGL